MQKKLKLVEPTAVRPVQLGSILFKYIVVKLGSNQLLNMSIQLVEPTDSIFKTLLYIII